MNQIGLRAISELSLYLENENSPSKDQRLQKARTCDLGTQTFTSSSLFNNEYILKCKKMTKWVQKLAGVSHYKILYSNSMLPLPK